MKIQLYGKRIVKRLDNKWDLVIAITGEEGVGKSCCAIQLSKAICHYAGFKFEMEKSEIFSPTPEEITDKVTKLPYNYPIILDEAIKVAYKQDWYTSITKYLSKFAKVCRKERKALIFCIPDFTDLSVAFRNSRVKVWLHLYDRGKGVIFVPDRANPLATDHWHVAENYQKLDTIFKRRKFASITPDEAIRAALGTRIGQLEIEFDDLTEKEWEQYLKAQEKTRYSDIGSLNSQYGRMKVDSNIDRGMMVMLLNMKFGMTFASINNFLGRRGMAQHWKNFVSTINLKHRRSILKKSKEFLDFEQNYLEKDNCSYNYTNTNNTKELKEAAQEDDKGYEKDVRPASSKA